jgi:hypothetical protein
MANNMSKRKIAEHDTYDPTDCVTSGWALTLYSDGHVAQAMLTSLD